MKKNIVIISDDPLFWNLFIPLLKKEIENIQIIIWKSFKEIIEYPTQTTYDLILMDGGMSRVSSIEVIQYIRANMHILAPIWFFPEIQSDAYIHKANEMGTSTIYMKPFDPYKVTDDILQLFTTTH